MSKISRPAPCDPLKRERLFAQIDHATRQQRALFIVAPPGAGKTTLAASWLEARRKRALWVQCDSADGDPANLFYYLREAAEPLRKKGAKALPPATPEFLADERGFARRFFRELFAGLPGETAIVFDDYHEIANTAVVHELIAGAILEVPRGSTVVFISRIEAPKAYARPLANGELGTLDAQSLKLSAEETRHIVRKRVKVNEETVAQLHEYCAGWPAGLVLLLDRIRRGVAFSREQRPELLHNVFDYFSTQILDALPEADRELLHRTAFLESFDASTANRITGSVSAGSIIEMLFRRNLFVERSQGSGMYQYHPLFAQFLRQQASERLSACELARVKAQSAVLLSELGMIEQAVALAIEAEAWDQAAKLIDAHGQAMSWHGRVGTLQCWINALPEAVSASRPWHRYWLANALLTTDPSSARALGQTAFGHFERLEDRLGMLASACLVLHSYHRDFSYANESADWLEAAERLRSQIGTFADPKMQLEIEIGLSIGRCFLQNDRPALERVAGNIEERLSLLPDDDRKLAQFTALMSCFNVFGRFRRAVELVRRAEYLAKSDSCSDYSKTFFVTKAFYPIGMSGDLEGAREFATLAAAWGRSARFESMLRIGLAALAKTYFWSDLPKAQEIMAELDQLPPSGNPYVQWHELYTRAKLAALLGLREQTVTHIRRAQAAAATAGFLFFKVESAAWFSDMALAVDDIDLAEQTARQGLALAGTTGACQQEVALRAVQALIAIRRADTADAVAHTARFLACCHDPDHLSYLRWMVAPLAPLIAFAAERKIETDFLPTLVSTLRIKPPIGSVLWPWVVRVHTFGAFRVEVNGHAPSTTRKTPKKALALLKALIAFGGRDVLQHKLIDALWPDKDGDAAQKAFEATLLRLRRLLGGNEVIRQSGGVVSLNQDKVFVDALALDCYGTFHEACNPDGGTFLPEEDAPWIVQFRARLDNRFMSKRDAETR